LLIANALARECFAFAIEDDATCGGKTRDNPDHDTRDERQKNATALRFFLHLVAECLGRVSQSVGAVASTSGYGDIHVSRYVCQSCRIARRRLGVKGDDDRVDFYYCLTGRDTDRETNEEDRVCNETFGDSPHECPDDVKIRTWHLRQSMAVAPTRRQLHQYVAQTAVDVRKPRASMRNGKRVRKAKQLSDLEQLATAVNKDFHVLWLQHVWPSANAALSACLSPVLINLVKGY
jgi:hypothetical protein